MAKGDSPTRGRELNIHFGDLVRGFVGQISHLGDMVPVMAGVTLSFKLRGEPRVGLVYIGDGATSTGAFHEGINFAAVQRCPLVVIVENNGYAYSTPTTKQTAATSFVDKGRRLRCGGRAGGWQRCPRDVRRPPSARSTGRARRRGHAGRADDISSQGPCGARQPVVRARRARSSAGSARTIPIDRYTRVLVDGVGVSTRELAAIDDRVQSEVDAATDEAETSPAPEGPDALVGVYADPPRADVLWFRTGISSAVTAHERPAGWGTHDG